MLLNCGVGEDSSESLVLQIKPVNPKRNQPRIFGRTDVEAETLNSLATWCEELPHLKRPWCWERLKAGGEAEDKRWDCRMVSSIQWTWVWASSNSWWWTGKPAMLQSMGLQSQTGLRDWIELNWDYSVLIHIIQNNLPFWGVLINIFNFICKVSVACSVNMFSSLGY